MPFLEQTNMNRSVVLLAAILVGVILCGIVAMIRPLHASDASQTVVQQVKAPKAVGSARIR
jgi:hypothetical protein